MIIKKQKKFFSFLFALFLGVGFFWLAPTAHAWAGEIIAGLISWIIGALGIILGLVMQALVSVAQYSNFINAPAVSNGWKIVRDICNMFFVLILLVIAFATILKIERYSYKKWLPKLILMAILINFSKTICGLLIDFAQIIMLTFVNAFKDIAAGNLITNLGITEILTLANDQGDVSFWSIVGAYVLGLLYLIIALVVIITMLAMLVMRIVMIWIYVVLSPAAYLLSAFPDGEKYASQWWTEFSKNLIVGPVLAFFIWLSFVSLQTQNFTNDFPVQGGSTQEVAGQVGITNNEVASTTLAGSKASDPNNFIKFVIAIGMLIGGLKISQEIGGAAGGLAGKGMAKISKGAAFAGGLGTGALMMARKGAGKVAGGAKDTALGLVARNQNVRNVLGRAGGSNIPVLNTLATRTRIGLESIDRKKRDKAREYVGKITDTRILNRLANQGNVASFTPWGREVRAAARNKMGGYNGAAIPHVNTMSAEDIRTNLNNRQISQLSFDGVRAARGTGFQEHLDTNRMARRAYNEGIVRDADTRGVPVNPADLVGGLGRNGVRNQDYGFENNQNTQLAGGVIPRGPDAIIFQNARGLVPNANPFAYKKLNPEGVTNVGSQVRNEARGSGNLSINELARGKSNTLAVDFDKLNIDGMDKGGANDFRNVAGVNTSDTNKIQEISSKMVGIIDQELAKLRGKGALNSGEQKRVANLEESKKLFSQPGKLNNLSLVNSSAAAYKHSDVKDTKIHEELHGLGYTNEDEVDTATQEIIRTRQYGIHKGAGAKDRVDKLVGSRTAEEVIKKEGAGASLPEIDVSNLNKSVDNFSKKIEEVTRKFKAATVNTKGIGQTSSSQPNFTYLFTSLRKAISQQNGSLNKKIASLGGGKASTPLEVDIISSQVSDDLK